jgi:hypothetical protein
MTFDSEIFALATNIMSFGRANITKIPITPTTTINSTKLNPGETSNRRLKPAPPDGRGCPLARLARNVFKKKGKMTFSKTNALYESEDF